MPEHPRPGETKYVRYALALPTSWRGFVQAFDTREEAADAWTPDDLVAGMEPGRQGFSEPCRVLMRRTAPTFSHPPKWAVTEE